MKKRLLLIFVLAAFVLCAAIAEADTWTCPVCGREGNTKGFCPGCGTPKPEEQEPDDLHDGLWDCDVCGFKGNFGKFCQECGSPRPAQDNGLWDCLVCGYKGNAGKFCVECGSKKPDNNVVAPTEIESQVEIKESNVWDGLVEGVDYVLFNDTIALLTHAPEGFDRQYCDAVIELTDKVAAALGYKEPNVVIYDTKVLAYYGIADPVTIEEASEANWLLMVDGLIEEYGYSFKGYTEYASSVEPDEENKVYIYIYETTIDETNEATVEASKSSAEDNDTGSTVTTFKNSNVRSGPGSSYDLLGSINSGTKLTIYGAVNSSDGTGQWYEIDYNGKRAYISTSTASEGEHVHTPVTLAAVAATCTNAGKTQGSVCSQCGAILKTQTTIPATGHTAVTLSGTAATCTTAGKTDGSYCSKCGATIKEQTTIAALGHSLTHVDAKAPTKTTVGWYAYDKCSRCSYSTYKERSLKAGSWSSWSTTAVSESSTRDVETKTEQETVYITKYSYSRYKYYNTTHQATYYSYANVGGGEWQYKTTTSPLSILKYIDGRAEYEGIWFNQTTSQEANGTKAVTYYRYRDYTE